MVNGNQNDSMVVSYSMSRICPCWAKQLLKKPVLFSTISGKLDMVPL